MFVCTMRGKSGAILAIYCVAESRELCISDARMIYGAPELRMSEVDPETGVSTFPHPSMQDVVFEVTPVRVAAEELHWYVLTDGTEPVDRCLFSRYEVAEANARARRESGDTFGWVREPGQ